MLRFIVQKSILFELNIEQIFPMNHESKVDVPVEIYQPGIPAAATNLS
jgi:hypothetical protein